MGKKYTTDELEVGGHMLDASMMGSLNTIVSAGSHTLAGYLTTYTDTTYSVGNGGLTEINFTSALNTKLAGIAAGANNYVLPFTNNSANWNTAYGWGNHAGLYATASHSHAQYIVEGGTSFSGVYPMVVRVGATSYYSDQDITFTGASSQLYVGGSIRTPILYDSNNTGYYVNPASTSNFNVINATGGNSTEWNTAYDWGNHASAGYVTSSGNTIIGTDTDINTSGATIIDNIYVTDGVITSMGTRNLTAGDIGAAYYDHFRSLGATLFTAGGGSSSSTTTALLIGEMENDGAFDSYTSAFKTSWSYASNDNLTDAGRFTETAGSSWLTWTDNSNDSSRGNITALAIAPNTGGSAGKVFIYNDQGSGYAPGWREVWTSTSDGSGSGLDADLLDGQHASAFQLAGTYNTVIGTDTDIDTSGATIIDNLYMTDGVITSHGTRNLTLADLGYTGATNANYITNNNQLTNGASYLTTSGKAADSNLLDGIDSSQFLRSDADDTVSAGATYTWARTDDAGIVFTNNTYNTQLAMGGWTTSNSSNVSRIRTSSGNLHIDSASNGALYLNWYSGGAVKTNSTLQSDDSLRAPIFYDSNNTAYYLDPAGTSKMHTIWTVGSGANSGPRWDTSFHVVQSQHWYGHSNSQTMYLGESSNPVRLRGSLRIGSNADADSGMALTVNGSANATTSLRAPIFYDSNNTNYYVNPNGESNLFKGEFSQLGLFRSPDASTSSYKLAMGGNINMYNNTIDYVAQLHFQDNVRFYDDGNDSYLNFKYGDATTGGIKFLNGGGTVKGYVFANAESFGLLDAGGNWAVKTAIGAAPLTLSSNSNPEFYVYDSYTVSPGSSRAPIFYDYNNTAYYLDPYGYSNLQGVQIGSGDLKMYENGSYSSELRFQNNTHHMGIDYQNNETLRFITRSGTTTVPITFQMRAGTITAANFILSSDKRKKTKIVDLSCDNIDVSWKSFEMKDNEGEYRTGVIAQELEQKHPEFVNTNDEGFKSVKYIDLLIAKIAELEARLEKLEK